MTCKFIAYYRVSTDKQGVRGLGIQAQQESVKRYVDNTNAELVREFIEVETGTGAQPLAKRVQLRAALQEAKRTGATLIVAKLDRLARNVRFFIEALDDYGIKLVFLDFPEVNPNSSEGRMLLITMANVAEYEGRRIGERTKAALQALKARGGKLGNPKNLVSNIAERQAAADAHAAKLSGLIAGMQARGLAQRAMVSELNDLGIKTSTGKTTWTLSQLQRVLARLPAQVLAA